MKQSTYRSAGRLGIVAIRTGFTLIELLVVVAIIALLIAILLPSLTRARDTARMIACGSNLRQIGIATYGYINDSGGFFPGHHTVSPLWIVWPARLRLYTNGDQDVFWCVSGDSNAKWIRRFGYANTGAMRYGYERDEVPLTHTTPFTYGYNDWGIKEFTVPHLGLGGHVDNPSGSDWAEASISKIRAPARMIAIADSTTDGLWDTAIDAVGDGAIEYPADRHLGNAQVLFADSHVEPMPQSHLIDTSDNGVRQMWNSDHLPHPEYGG